MFLLTPMDILFPAQKTVKQMKSSKNIWFCLFMWKQPLLGFLGKGKIFDFRKFIEELLDDNLRDRGVTCII